MLYRFMALDYRASGTFTPAGSATGHVSSLVSRAPAKIEMQPCPSTVTYMVWRTAFSAVTRTLLVEQGFDQGDLHLKDTILHRWRKAHAYSARA